MAGKSSRNGGKVKKWRESQKWQESTEINSSLENMQCRTEYVWRQHAKVESIN